MTDTKTETDRINWVREAGHLLVNAGELLLHGEDPLGERVTEAMTYLSAVQALMLAAYPDRCVEAIEAVADLVNGLVDLMGDEWKSATDLTVVKGGDDSEED